MSEQRDDRWSWTDEVWQREFAPLRAAGYELERVTQKVYWSLHESELRAHFPAEAFINTVGLRTPSEVAGQQRLDETRDDHPLRTYCIVRERDALVATFTGHQHENGAYRMHHTTVHSDYRRKGVYKLILRCTIAYTKALGFDAMVSEHAPGNNPVLIAKLKAGFRIVSMDIDPMVGVSIKLRYFHNPDHLAAYEFRCGLATINPRLLKHGSGAMSLLIEQFRADDSESESGS